MKMTTKAQRHKSWLAALKEAAKTQGFDLPPFTVRGMGSAQSARVADGRFVTLKHRLHSCERPTSGFVQWAFWHGTGHLPLPVASFRVPSEPTSEEVAVALPLL